ncbi:2Fe-2S iron-sulfur cluster binding domain-containing protein [Pseudomonas aeruginosa]|nr:2Fe-2S iron-sulfur cluster binding domain-containing protein [Pseudomonas aeruginosa]HBO3207951.1 2Fe-2S iron-sulfur cluster binding domain-containing protein [Pseudomonas aeruginosa]HCI1918093.1 2Fe-2S iron-sulfur cluster binding domain-containing protein [Pseudomonas aeruginosa]
MPEAEHLVRITTGGEAHYVCRESETVLRGMLRLGCKGIPVGCLGGGCGICKIKVLKGAVRTLGPMSRAHVSAEEEQQGCYLACKVAPLESLTIEVLSKKVTKSLSIWAGREKTRA